MELIFTDRRRNVACQIRLHFVEWCIYNFALKSVTFTIRLQFLRTEKWNKNKISLQWPIYYVKNAIRLRNTILTILYNLQFLAIHGFKVQV